MIETNQVAFQYNFVDEDDLDAPGRQSYISIGGYQSGNFYGDLITYDISDYEGQNTWNVPISTLYYGNEKEVFTGESALATINSTYPYFGVKQAVFDKFKDQFDVKDITCTDDLCYSSNKECTELIDLFTYI